MKIDSYFDLKPTEKFEAKIKSKNNPDKLTGYSLVISEWKDREGGSFENIPKELYNSLNYYDNVYIIYHPGYLGIPWYELSKN